MDLSIIIPAYNEATRLPATLTAIDRYLVTKKITSEILVIDDGSQDHTTEAIKKVELKTPLRVLHHQTNHGKGEAVRTGMLAGRGAWLLMMDADHSIPITELDKLWALRENADLVLGSRFVRGSRFGTQRWSRMLMSKAGNLLFRFLFRLPIRDTQCGFKLFHKAAARKIFNRLSINHFGFDMEVIVRAHQQGYRLKEVPISWHDAPSSSVRAVHAGWETLRDLFRLWQASNKKISKS